MDWLIYIVFALLVLVLYSWYAGIISKKNKVLESLSGIDVQLKKRSNLIPNILSIAQKFMDHEKSLITEITSLRVEAISDYKHDASSVKDHLATAEKLAGKMGQLMVAVENYPDLKSDSNMLQAQQSYNEVEAQIAAARRFYNSSVGNLNTSVQVFPGNLIAGLAGASEMPFYEADEEAVIPVQATSYLS